MRSAPIRSRFPVERGALFLWFAISSACTPAATDDGGGGNTTGGANSGGSSGTGGGGAGGSSGAIGTGGDAGSSVTAGAGGSPSSGGASSGGAGLSSTGGSGDSGGGGDASATGGTGGDGGAAGSGAGMGGAAGSSAGTGGGMGGSTATPPSCTPGGPGMTDCGAARENCCQSLDVAGGTFNRSYRNTGSGPTNLGDPATVSGFRLDKYLVTVGRYRQFAAAWTGGWMPAAGAGKHAYLSGGGLTMTSGGVETGWDTTWATNVRPTTASLTGGSYCDRTHATWTASAGNNETLPINCVNWYEAYAFCIWDAGFLPSEAEWEFAAAGGTEQRQYPWGTAAPGAMSQYAIYGSYYTTNSTGLAPVGTATMGAGRFGQLDLAGEIWEWNLDWKNPYVNPCNDCVSLTRASYRIVRGDNFGGSLQNLVPTVRGGDIAPEGRDSNFGFRCSRAP